MPKETFINLPEAKKDKITNAILKEFARESFNKASISNIIKEAEIPRGSFYQYFEDKEDAIRYIIDSFLENEQKELLGFLVESKGDIFETSLRLFERLVEKSEEKEKLKLYKNILEESRKNNISIFNKNSREKNIREDFIKYINIDNFEVKNTEDIKDIVKLLMILTRNTTINVISKKIEKEEGKKELLKQFEILKRGILKNKD